MLPFRTVERSALWGAALAVVAFCGCGADEYKVAPVQGRVLCGGNPVSGGYVFLTPINDPSETGRREGFGGKSGVGVVKADGTFVVGTYGDRDGALIGRHRIRFEFPELPESDEEWGDLEPDEAERLRSVGEIACRAGTDVEEFTVSAGSNELVINLTER